MKLYFREVSGNAYKVRLFLELLKQDYELEMITGPEQKAPEFLALNPRGQIPVLVDGDLCLSESIGILVYLARKYGDDSWFPTDPVAMAEVLGWMGFAADEVKGLALARAIKKLKRPMNYEDNYNLGMRALNTLETRMKQREWVALDHVTIADIAVYPYVGLAPDAEISLEGFPAVRDWMQRIQNLPGYIDMPGIDRI